MQGGVAAAASGGGRRTPSMPSTPSRTTSEHQYTPLIVNIAYATITEVPATECRPHR
jgi:hypothetical protein